MILVTCVQLLLPHRILTTGSIRPPMDLSGVKPITLFRLASVYLWFALATTCVTSMSKTWCPSVRECISVQHPLGSIQIFRQSLCGVPEPSVPAKEHDPATEEVEHVEEPDIAGETPFSTKEPRTTPPSYSHENLQSLDEHLRPSWIAIVSGIAMFLLGARLALRRRI